MPCSTRLVAAWLSAPVKLVQKPFCAAPPPPPPDAGQLLGAQNLHASVQHQRVADLYWHTLANQGKLTCMQALQSSSVLETLHIYLIGLCP